MRGHRDLFERTGWMGVLRAAGLRTVTISSVGERHSAWHWYAGFSEIYNPGKRGMHVADDVTPLALDWLRRHGASDGWFLHVNYWDPPRQLLGSAHALSHAPGLRPSFRRCAAAVTAGRGGAGACLRRVWPP